MQLDHTFTVPVAADMAWEALLDFERVAPCLPGATLADIKDDVLEGAVKVKLGPVLLNYQGTATILERNPASHTMVMDGRAKDSKGNGTAAAKITARLEKLDADNTAVHVRTELDVTGRPAQFGRGLMQDVSNKIVGQFADRLASELSNPRPSPVSGTWGAAPSGQPQAQPDRSDDNEPLDLGGLLPRPSVNQIVVGTLGIVLTGAVILRLIRRR